jgi:hypothetical protein
MVAVLFRMKLYTKEEADRERENFPNMEQVGIIPPLQHPALKLNANEKMNGSCYRINKVYKFRSDSKLEKG